MIQPTLTLKMTTAQQVVETLVTVNNVHPDDQTQPTHYCLLSSSVRSIQKPFLKTRSLLREYLSFILRSTNHRTKQKRNSFQGKHSSYKGDSMHEFRENEHNFGRSDFWDNLRGQARAFVIRWYPMEPVTNHCLWNLRKSSQKSLCTKLVPIRPVGIKAANI